VFSATFNDPNGSSDLLFTQLLVNQTASGTNGCFLSHLQGSGMILLASDDMTGWSAVTLGTSQVAQNSRCILSASGSTVTESGNTLTLNASLTFKAAALGPANLYLRAIDERSQDTGFVAAGTYNIVVQAAPQTGNLYPASHTGMGTLFTAAFSDANGASDLLFTQVLVNSSPTASQGCFISHMPGRDVILLASDDVTSWSAIRPGTSDTAENSRCRLNGTSSAVLAAGNTFTMVLGLTFKSAAAGGWKVYSRAIDTASADTGFWEKANLTVSTATAATVGAVTPNAGSGLAATFSLAVSHPTNATLIDRVRLRAGAQPGGPNACVVEYRRAANEFYLANNDESVWTLVRPGTSDTTANSQCRFYGTGSSAVAAGSSLTVNFQTGFYSAWPGTRNLYAEVITTGGISSGWVKAGTYTVFSDGSTPEPQ
jgi:hypothetical protein